MLLFGATGWIAAAPVIAGTFIEGDENWSAAFAIGVGCNGRINAILAHPDGTYTVGGDFGSCGDAAVRNVARYDPATRQWSPLAPDDPQAYRAEVFALAEFSGALYVGGDGDGLTRWDGNGWERIGPEAIGRVRALAAVGDALYVGGILQFTDADGVWVDSLARWDGTTMKAFHHPKAWMHLSEVEALAEWQGDLIVAGYLEYLYSAGNQRFSARGVVRFDGEEWRALGTDGGSGVAGTVNALSVWNGALYVTGSFTAANWNGQASVPANRIARWDGVQWSALGEGFDARGLALAASGDGLFAGGLFSNAGGMPAQRLARWDGVDWHGLSVGPLPANQVVALAPALGGGVAVGGRFGYAADVADPGMAGAVLNHVGVWEAGVWDHWGVGPGGGFNGPVVAIARFNGDLYAGGVFSSAGGRVARNIARWDGAQWHPLGSGESDGTNAIVRAMVATPHGLFVGGEFTEVAADGIATQVRRIARWDGAAWHAVGDGGEAGFNGGVHALHWAAPDLYAGGVFGSPTAGNGFAANHIARWDGVQWHALMDGTGKGVAGAVKAIAVYAGDVFVAGEVRAIAGGLSEPWRPVNSIARWDGSAWHEVGSAGGNGVVLGSVHFQTINALHVHRGELYAGGAFSSANHGGDAQVGARHLARWDGTRWHAVGGGAGYGLNAPVFGLGSFAGRLVVAGQFTAATSAVGTEQPLGGVAEWHGGAWHPFGSGLGGAAYAVSVDGTAGVHVGGVFGRAGDTPSAHFGLFSTGVVFGSGFED
jgi:trimeric autotransporter adhesin